MIFINADCLVSGDTLSYQVQAPKMEPIRPLHWTLPLHWKHGGDFIRKDTW